MAFNLHMKGRKEYQDDFLVFLNNFHKNFTAKNNIETLLIGLNKSFNCKLLDLRLTKLEDYSAGPK